MTYNTTTDKMSSYEIKIREIKKSLKLNFFKLIEKRSAMKNHRLQKIYFDYMEEVEKFYDFKAFTNKVFLDALTSIKKIILHFESLDKFCITDEEFDDDEFYDEYVAFDHEYSNFVKIFNNDVNPRGNLNYDEYKFMNDFLIDLTK